MSVAQEETVWRPDASRVLRHGVFSGLQHSVSLVVGFLLLPYMLGRLGSERYGLLLTLQIVSMSGVLGYADFGFHAGLVRFLGHHYVTRNAAQFQAIFSSGIAAFFVLGLACCALVVAFGQLFFFRIFQIPPQFGPELKLGVYLYAASFLLQMPIISVKAFFAGVQELGLLRLWETIERVGYAAMVAVLLLFSTRITYIILVEQFVLFTALVTFSTIAARRFPALFRPSWRKASWPQLRTILPMSTQVFVNRLSFIAYQRCPEIFIAAFLGPVSLAAYSIVMKIPRALKGFGANSTAFAAATALDSLQLHNKLALLILRGARYMYLLLTPLFAYLIIFADQVLLIWVGPEYVGLANLMRASLVWQYIMFLVFHLNSTFTREEQLRSLMPRAIAANVVFFVTVAALIKTWGLWAIMAGLLLSAIITAFAWARVQFRSNDLRIRDFFNHVFELPVLTVGGICIAVLWAFRIWFGAPGLFGLGVTLSLLYAVHTFLLFHFALTPVERKQVLRVVGRG